MREVQSSAIPVNQIIEGSALDVIRGFPHGCIDTVITSPPYWGLRTYDTEPQIWGGSPDCQHEWHCDLNLWHPDRGENPHKEIYDRSFQSKGTESSTCRKCNAWRGELGLEPYFFQYVEHLCSVFDEVKRVLKPSGTLWVNLGDTYGTGQGGGSEKSLCQIPSRFGIAMAERGWILRNEIIWHKPNCMPSSVKDRFTVDFDKIFFFAKAPRYYFEAQYEKALTPGSVHQHTGRNKMSVIAQTVNPTYLQHMHVTGALRHKRAVWFIPTKPFANAHYAVYPEALLQTPIAAACPEFVCKRCGAPRKKIYRGRSAAAFNIRVRDVKKGRIKHSDRKASGEEVVVYDETSYGGGGRAAVGYSDCGCGAAYEPGIVLDPFIGSGTTALVALALNRRFIGIELNPEYVQMARDRISQLFGNGNQTKEK